VRAWFVLFNYYNYCALPHEHLYIFYNQILFQFSICAVIMSRKLTIIRVGLMTPPLTFPLLCVIALVGCVTGEYSHSSLSTLLPAPPLLSSPLSLLSLSSLSPLSLLSLSSLSRSSLSLSLSSLSPLSLSLSLS
jgi:hypothetical protein